MALVAVECPRSEINPLSNPQQSSLVLTLLGPDRPGLVERVSQILAAYQGNWVESRMAHLAGQFAGILRVDLPATSVDGFKETCEALSADGLQVLVASTEPDPPPSQRSIFELELVGQDRPGIVWEISQALTRSGINVEELETGVQSAPMSGEKLFYVKARLAAPHSVTAEALTEVLEPIGNDLMVDITLGPAK